MPTNSQIGDGSRTARSARLRCSIFRASDGPWWLPATPNGYVSRIPLALPRPVQPSTTGDPSGRPLALALALAFAFTSAFAEGKSAGVERRTGPAIAAGNRLGPRENMPACQRREALRTAISRFTAVDAPGVDHSWFGRLASAYLARRLARARVASDAATIAESERAKTAIRSACVKCALTGAASGTVTTAAELLTAETGGLAALATVPVAALTVGGEMVFRAVVHLGLTCDLAEIFGVPFDARDRTAFWRLCALAFGISSDGDGSADLGQQLVKSMLQPDQGVGSSIGSMLLSESVLRNIVPVVAPVTSSAASWRMTRRLGETVSSYMRYHRAFRDEMLEVGYRCEAHFGLLAEGLWFLFSADGRLSPEETAVLAYLVRLLPADERPLVMARFVEDEQEWQQRLTELPENERDDFFHALEIAATVDKVVTLPERRLLRGAARVLGRKYDDARIAQMVKDFGDVGVLRGARARQTGRG